MMPPTGTDIVVMFAMMACGMAYTHYLNELLSEFSIVTSFIAPIPAMVTYLIFNLPSLWIIGFGMGAYILALGLYIAHRARAIHVPFPFLKHPMILL